MIRMAKNIIAAGMLVLLIGLLFGTIAVAFSSESEAETPTLVVQQNINIEMDEWIPTERTSSTALVKIEQIQEVRRAEASAIYSIAPEVEKVETAKFVCGVGFDADDVTTPSYLTAEMIAPFIEVYCPCFVGLEEYLTEIDKQVNLVFILAVARCETDGGAPHALVGDYNIFNIRNGDGSYCNYTSYKESLDHFVRLLTIEYLHPDGIYYEGVSIDAVGKHYAVPEWAPFITSVCEDVRWLITKD